MARNSVSRDTTRWTAVEARKLELAMAAAGRPEILRPGHSYILMAADYDSLDKHERQQVKVEMELVKIYEHFALFKRGAGVRECFGWHELRSGALVREC